MEWFSLLFPIFALVYLFSKGKDYHLIYFPIFILGSSLLIFISSLIISNNMMQDEEYRSSLVVEAQYYEYWEYWKEETCSRQVACGEDCSSDSKGNLKCTTKYCTEYYDCSYCKENIPYWVALDQTGKSWNIAESKYNFLTKKWNATTTFYELNRKINKRNDCGIDGDMYSIKWGGKTYQAEGHTWITSFKNRTKLEKSAFKFETISDSNANKAGLYNYPKVLDYQQNFILGLEKSNNTDSHIDSIRNLYAYFNGYHGVKNKIHVFICLFKDKPISTGIKQQHYWEGGNQNELVICIGHDKDDNINWVYPFSWCDDKRLLVDCREDIANVGVLDFEAIFQILENTVSHNYKYKNLDLDFEYLDTDLNLVSIVIIYLLVIIYCVGTILFIEKS